MQRYDRSSWRVGLLQSSYSLKGARQVRGQGRVSERCYQGSYGEQNRCKPYNAMAEAMHGSAVCLSIDQKELLGEHRGVEAGGRKGRGSDDESRGT